MLRTVFLVKVFFIIFMVFSGLVSIAAENRPSCSTTQCHNDLKSGDFLHKPLKSNGCRVCHLEVKPPQTVNDHPKLLPYSVSQQIESCFVCHSDISGQFQKKHGVHSVVAKKGCVACHDPHSAKHKKLLTVEPKIGLCLNCHKKYAKTERLNIHHASQMKQGCLDCHAAHSSKHGDLLVTAKKEICSSCHKKAILTSRGKKIFSIEMWNQKPHLHKPVKEGKCLKCHDVHGSENENTLKGQFSAKAYLPLKEISGSICFDCHFPSLVQLENVTSRTTRFHDRGKNLHNLHVLKTKKKRNCQACHEVHGSNHPFLIKDAFYYKGILLPIKFAKTERGGTCTTACHSRKSYDRGEVQQ